LFGCARLALFRTGVSASTQTAHVLRAIILSTPAGPRLSEAALDRASGPSIGKPVRVIRTGGASVTREDIERLIGLAA